MNIKTRWQIIDSGIEWDLNKEQKRPHDDHLEMSGLMTSLIVRYGIDSTGQLLLKKHVVWPSFRTIPNNTGASFQVDMEPADMSHFEIDGKPLIEVPDRFRFDGVLTIFCHCPEGLEIIRYIFPSVDNVAVMESISVRNCSENSLTLQITNNHHRKYGRGCNGVYIVESTLHPEDTILLKPGMETTFSEQISARLGHKSEMCYDVIAELKKRQNRVGELTSPLQLDTGTPEIDMAFHLAKLRAGESIFQTRGGLMHSPGGRTYYAATWCNDQIEYAGPWFAFTGDKTAIEASLNAYRQYMPFMGPEYFRIPSSVIAEGFDIWEGRGDRGDAAMYAYGASRFALACGDRNIAMELWPAIRWCLEYCRRKLNNAGVVESDSDELEDRLPSGDANLCTSSLYYGGLASAAYLAKNLDDQKTASVYSKQAKELAKNIETFFGRNLHDWNTYRYYEGNTVLRSWISIPLCMGILNRSNDTVNAMFSPYLWNDDGMFSQEGDHIFWDRSTLYGLRGAFIAGATDMAWTRLKEYSLRRLLGDHVPYPVEAWPEGDCRHLSAESALYCRVISEGLFGIEALGLNIFKLTPRLPCDCPCMSLRGIRAFGQEFDIIVKTSEVKIEKNDSIIWQGEAGSIIKL